MEAMEEDVQSPAASDVSDRLSSMPEEILLQIWMHVEHAVPLSRTSKRFQALSKSTLWRAKWFLKQYQRYQVIYEAIARPNLCTSALLKQLFRLGAPLSRSLVQLLHALRDPQLRQTLLLHNTSPALQTSWGRHVRHSSYAAIINHSSELYGDDVSFEPAKFDSYTFSKWLELAEDSQAAAELRERVKMLFSTFNFMPLLFTMTDNPRGEGLRITKTYSYMGLRSVAIRPAIVRCPALAIAAAANGYEMCRDDTEELIEDIRCPTGRFVRGLDGPAFTGTALVEALKVDGIVRVSKWFIEQSLVGLESIEKGFEYHGQLLVRRLKPPRARQRYNTLSYLDQQSALPFKLSNVVSEYLTPFLRGSVTAPMITMLERVERDFPHLDCVRALFVRAMFIKAERVPTEDPDVIKAMMKGHDVLSPDVLSACLRNRCRTTAPIRFAIKYVAGFALDSFVGAITLALLCQPYRGIMLHELYRFFSQTDYSIDFPAILAQVVETQAFSCDQLPPQQWEVVRSPDSIPVCNTVAPVRSLVAFNYAGGNAKPVNLCECEGPHFFNTPLVSAGSQPPRELKMCKRRLMNETRGCSLFLISDATGFGGFQHFQLEAWSTEWRNMGSFCNVFGPISEDDQPVGEVVVDILGPRSFAANIILSHAIVNGNSSLVDSLLDLGLTLTLEHFKIALKVGYSLSESMVRSIENGAPFRHSFGCVHEQADVGTVSRSVRGLADDEWLKCQELATSPSSNILLEIDVQDDGSLIFNTLAARRRRPEPVIRAAASRPSLSLREAAMRINIDDSLHYINNVKQWLSQLVTLSYREEQKNTVLTLIAADQPVSSDASTSLRSFIVTLRDSVRALRDEGHEWQLAHRAVQPLWKELREAPDGALLLESVHMRLEQSQRDVRPTRSSRRAAFKRSPYSYKSDAFRSSFAVGNPPVLHEPQLEPLADEDSDENYTQEESDTESIDSDSEMSAVSDAEDDEYREPAQEPPKKRRKIQEDSTEPYSLASMGAPVASAQSSPGDEMDNEPDLSDWDSDTSEPWNLIDCVDGNEYEESEEEEEDEEDGEASAEGESE